MNIKLDHFDSFVVYYDGWFSHEYSTLEAAREFIKLRVSEGDDIGDFSIEGRMSFEVE